MLRSRGALQARRKTARAADFGQPRAFIAPWIGTGGRAAARASEFKLASPPVATRNGLASPVPIGAPAVVMAGHFFSSPLLSAAAWFKR
jgi:hypothetical protein